MLILKGMIFGDPVDRARHLRMDHWVCWRRFRMSPFCVYSWYAYWTYFFTMLMCLNLSSKWVVAELCSLIFVENMKKQRQEVRYLARLKWWSGMDEKVPMIKIRPWNLQILSDFKNSFFRGSKNDKTLFFCFFFCFFFFFSFFPLPFLFFFFFPFLDAPSHLYKRVCPSVRLAVGP